MGTPGRLLDLINRGILRLDHVTTVVLDEADEMLDLGSCPMWKKSWPPPAPTAKPCSLAPPCRPQ